MQIKLPDHIPHIKPLAGCDWFLLLTSRTSQLLRSSRLLTFLPLQWRNISQWLLSLSRWQHLQTKWRIIFLLFALQSLEHVSIRVMWKYSIFNTNRTCTIVFFLILYIFRTGQPYFVMLLNRRMPTFTINNISWKIPHPRSEHVVRYNAVILRRQNWSQGYSHGCGHMVRQVKRRIAFLIFSLLNMYRTGTLIITNNNIVIFM